jgi:RNA polymerase sigma-70 factor (ECF subfamily)
VSAAGHEEFDVERNPEEDRDDGVRPIRWEAELDDLAVQAAAGDKRALERLLRLIRAPVVHYCRAKMGNGIGLLTAEDVAQDVLFAVCGALARFRPGETPTIAFVYGIAHNKVVDAFRADRRDRSVPTEAEAVPDSVDLDLGPEAAAVLGTEVRHLRKFLAMLPAAHREILVLRIALQFSAIETARAVGSTPGAVRVTQHRAMTRLRKLIAEHDDEGEL